MLCRRLFDDLIKRNLIMFGISHKAQIVGMRQEAPIANVSEISERIPGIPTEATRLLSTVRSNVYTLVSDGYLTDSEVIGRIRCVVRVDPASPKGYVVLYWNESNIEL